MRAKFRNREFARCGGVKMARAFFSGDLVQTATPVLARLSETLGLSTHLGVLHRREIEKLQSATREKGLALVPTRLYMKNGRIKCEIAIAKGKKFHDKREAERARSDEEEARTAIRNSKLGA